MQTSTKHQSCLVIVYFEVIFWLWTSLTCLDSRVSRVSAPLLHLQNISTSLILLHGIRLVVPNKAAQLYDNYFRCSYLLREEQLRGDLSCGECIRHRTDSCQQTWYLGKHFQCINERLVCSRIPAESICSNIPLITVVVAQPSLAKLHLASVIVSPWFPCETGPRNCQVRFETLGCS